MAIPSIQTSPFNHTYIFGNAGSNGLVVRVHKKIVGADHCQDFLVNIDVPLFASITEEMFCPTLAIPDMYNFIYHSNATTSSGNYVTQYDWKLDGTAIGTSANTNMFGVDAVNSHNLTLTVKDNLFNTCTLSYIPTSIAPTRADITANPISIPTCENQTVVYLSPTFINSSNLGNVATVSWDFGDGSSYLPLDPTNINAQKVYSAFTALGQNYNIKLDITDKLGCTYTGGLSLAVNQNQLLGGLSQSPSAVICPGDVSNILYSPSIINPIIIPTSYLWSNSATTNPISATFTGQYLVTVTDNVSGCKREIPTFMDVQVINVPDPVIRGKTNFCDGEMIHLDGNLGALVTYNWILPLGMSNNTSLTGNTIDINAATIGTYDITLEVTTSNCTKRITKTIVINAAPILPDLTEVNDPACENTTTSITVINFDAALYSLTWSNGMSGTSIIVHNFGVYQAIFTDIVTGCTSAKSNMVNSGIDLGWLVTGCIEQCSDITNHIIIPGNNTIQNAKWDWIVNGNIVDAGNNISIRDLDLNNQFGGGSIPAGVYSIQIAIENSNGCQIISDPLLVTIQTCPCSIQRVDSHVVCIGEDINGVQWGQFSFNAYFIPALSNTAQIQLLPTNNSQITLSNYLISGTSLQLVGILGIDPNLPPPCYNLIYTDPQRPNENCSFYFCPILSLNCTPTSCNDIIETPVVTCGNGSWLDQVYNVSFLLNPNGILQNVIYSTNNGTLTGFPSVVGPGPAPILVSGTYTVSPPTNNILTIRINYYDNTAYPNNVNCFYQEDLQLPDCYTEFPERNSDSTTLIANNQDLILRISPIPAGKEFKVMYNLGNNEKGKLVITDMQGREILTRYLVAKDGLITYENTKLDAGIYFVNLIGSNQSVIKKLIIN